jgi:hypothetical protein
MNSKEKPIAIVTGVSRGVGLGSTLAFIRHGYDVVGWSRNFSECKGLQASFNLVLIDGDISKKETLAKVAEVEIEHFGRIDLSVKVGLRLRRIGRGSADAGQRFPRSHLAVTNPRKNTMKATKKLYDLGQSLWLDNITRALLKSGTLRGYIDDLSVTGLTSNPTIFDHAIKNSPDYDAAISQKLKEGKSGEGLFFELALEDLTQAADLFRPIHELTCGVDGWVSLEVSPLLAHDTKTTLAEAKDLHARAARPNLFIKIPGTKEGLPAIEEAIFAGIPINVTLLFSREHYVAAAEAYLRGIERRIDAGLRP